VSAVFPLLLAPTKKLLGAVVTVPSVFLWHLVLVKYGFFDIASVPV